jgi:uncharacterized protein (DUF924 family)
MSSPDAILDFWFGPIAADGTASKEHAARWWKKDAAFDAELRERFGDVHAQASRGELDHWAATPRGRVALVIVLDQLSRNLNRGSGEAFANDARALALTEEAAGSGELDALAPLHAYFLLMPFMHAEDVGAQRRGVALFRELAARAPSQALRPMLEGAVEYAERHRVIVERFGRFPHRNEALGRESTDEEREFLTQPGSSF